MKPDQASHTADGAAAMRACGTFIKDPRLRCPDDLSRRLISDRLKRVVHNPISRRLVLAYYKRRLPGMYEAHLARTRHYDHLVRAELERGAAQYVILGAGLDSRPYRFRETLAGAQVFEVDHPATSAFKRARLEAASIDASHVTFVEVDFKRERTQDRLEAHGFDPDAPTVITWEGVIMYLDAQIVSDMMRWTSRLGAGSSIAFDYTYPGFHLTPEKYKHAKRHLSYVDKVGEPYTYGLEFDEVEGMVSACGLSLESNVDAAEMYTRYLEGHRGAPTPWYAIAHARRAA